MQTFIKMDFTFKDIEALQNLIDPNGEMPTEYNNFATGSMLNPGSIGQ